MLCWLLVAATGILFFLLALDILMLGDDAPGSGSATKVSGAGEADDDDDDFQIVAKPTTPIIRSEWSARRLARQKVRNGVYKEDYHGHKLREAASTAHIREMYRQHAADLDAIWDKADAALGRVIASFPDGAEGDPPEEGSLDDDSEDSQAAAAKRQRLMEAPEGPPRGNPDSACCSDDGLAAIQRR